MKTASSQDLLIANSGSSSFKFSVGEATRQMGGYKEEGTTTTPFDMTVLNDLDRFHLVIDVIERVAGLGSKGAYLKQLMRDKLIEHQQYITEHGEDMPEVRQWRWFIHQENQNAVLD